MLRLCEAVLLFKPRGDFGAAEGGNQVAIRVKDLNADDGGVAIPVRRELDRARDPVDSSEGAVGVEPDQLKRRRVTPAAERLPGSKTGPVAGRRRIVNAGGRAPALKLNERLKHRHRDTLTVSQ